MPESDPHVFLDAESWQRWLDANAETETEAWLKMAKKNSGFSSPTSREALEVALCFGWIDGQRKGLDDAHYLQRYCRRRPQSTWSQVNVEIVARLAEEGRMRPGGLREVERAQADGRWDIAYVSQKEFVVPDDLRAALDANPAAATAYAALGKTAQYLTAFPAIKAKTPAGRASAIATAVARLAASSATPLT